MKQINNNLTEHLFLKLKLSTERILELDLESNHSTEQLSKLQTEQNELREKIDEIGLHLNESESSWQLRKIIRECMDLQTRANVKMVNYRLELARGLRQIENGHKARNGYQISTIQVDGYFIDKHN